MYNQKIKGGYKKDFETFLSKAQNLKRFRFDLHLHSWKEQFGIKNIIVRPLEIKQLYKEDLCTDFLKCIGCIASYDKFIWSENKNKSPDYKPLEIMRYASNLISDEISKKQSSKLLKFIKKMDLNVLSVEDIQSKPLEFININRDLPLNFLKIFETSNSNIAREYFLREDGRLFYEELDDK